MSWNEILKRKGAHINRRFLGTNQMGNKIGIDRKKESESEKVSFAGTKVGLCAARDCVNNKGGQCTLEYISVGPKGNCTKYQQDSDYSRGQQSLIDRTRQQTNKPPAPLGGESTYEEV